MPSDCSCTAEAEAKLQNLETSVPENFRAKHGFAASLYKSFTAEIQMNNGCKRNVVFLLLIWSRAWCGLNSGSIGYR